MRIFIDPGHGGRDSGAIGYTGYEEAVFNLEWAQLTNMLAKRRGHETFISRTGLEPVKVPNIERAHMANEWGADVYVSLHANGFSRVVDDKSYGMEVLYWYKSTKGLYLADEIRREILARFGGNIYDRGSKYRKEGERGATVLSQTNMPAVIVEPGFITDPDDEYWLRQFSTQALLAEAVVAAVEKLQENT